MELCLLRRFRFITGLGIGGEYAAINSAIDELIPGRVRGTVDLIINGTFWLGAVGGSLASMYLLGGHGIAPNVGWRIAFATGAVLGGGVLLLRLRVPESPRWLMLRGREDEANKVVTEIEERAKKQKGDLAAPEGERLKISVRDHTPWSDIFRNMLGDNRQRSLLALALMVGQSFFFNAIFFSYGLIVKKFFGIADKDLPLHLLPFAIASFLGPRGPRSPLRSHRAQADDHDNLRDRRPRPCRRHLPLRARHAHEQDAEHLLQKRGHVLSIHQQRTTPYQRITTDSPRKIHGFASPPRKSPSKQEKPRLSPGLFFHFCTQGASAWRADPSTCRPCRRHRAGDRRRPLPSSRESRRSWLRW